MFEQYEGIKDEEEEQEQPQTQDYDEEWTGSKEYLEKMNFPADRNTLLEQAKGIRAPSDVINFLSRLADKTYESLEDLWEAAKKIITH